jgi:peptide/nickel transport system permease protein
MINKKDIKKKENQDESLFVASQWKLMWWRFLKHKMAVISGIFLLIMYLIVPFADFLATSDPENSQAYNALMPPQQIHWFEEGRLKPHVYGFETWRDPETFKRVYKPNPNEKYYISFFAKGYSYKFLGFIPANRHLIGIKNGSAEENLFLLGTDNTGRDFLSRILVGSRTSLTIGLVGVFISVFLGVLLGAVSGYFSGIVDLLIQRIIEIFQSIPTIPLWMGLAAALPHDWSVTQVYFAITIIISMIGWTNIARVVRGQMLSIRNQDNILAAKLMGCSQLRIITKHMIPVTFSYIIAAASLQVPRMIVNETALSFLGIGMRPPAISWGVLLHSAQNIHTIAVAPWLLLTVIPVMLVVLGFNFVGDGLRDAADPY